MSQNIELLNVQYPDVPAVILPKTGGGNALFTDVTDTTAVQADVRSGKVFFDASGNMVIGSGQSVIRGTFTTPSSSGAKTLSLPYTGNGYPVEAMFCIANGMNNNTSTGDTNWYNKIQRYAIGLWVMAKSEFDSVPSYGVSGSNNTATVITRYKNSNSDAVTHASSGLSSAIILTTTASNGSNNGCTAIRFNSATQLSYFVASNSYGLLASTEYDYLIRYSS